MSRSAKLLRNGLFPLATALSLGFGVSQALAAPQEEPTPAERYCNFVQCNNTCQSWWYDYGVCEDVGCRCYYY